jgi:hypothetical protein
LSSYLSSKIKDRNAKSILGLDTLETVEVTDNQSRIVNATITRTQEYKIPETYIMAVGIIVLILLIPEIKKAKVGTIELETSHEPLPAQTLSV